MEDAEEMDGMGLLYTYTDLAAASSYKSLPHHMRHRRCSKSIPSLTTTSYYDYFHVFDLSLSLKRFSCVIFSFRSLADVRLRSS